MNNFLRTILLILATGILLLVVLVGSSLWMVNANNAYSREILQLREARASIVNLMLTLQDAETGQRGYVATQRELYLAPYKRALGQVERRRERFRATAAMRPDLMTGLAEVEGLIDGKMQEMAAIIALVQAGDGAGAVAMMQTDRGLRLMDDIRGILMADLDAVDGRLGVIAVEQIAVAGRLQWVTVGAVLAIFAVLGGGLFVIGAHVRALSRARARVEELNAGLEERVNERTRELMRANQEIQRFAYIVTHDLRAPLVNIMGFLSEFEESLKPLTAYVMADGKPVSEQDVKDARFAVEEDLPEAIGFIRSSTRKMDQLINAILKISRDGQRRLVPEQIDLRALVDSAAGNVRHQVGSNGGDISINLERARRIVSDRISLDQIFGNLFDNAVKYQDPSRPLQLSVTSYPLGRGRIGVDVTDNGRGIAPQDFERVFELFRRAGQQDQPGEGIGLAHVRSLIRNLGGDITVESEPGKGSTFKLNLPADLATIVRSTES